MLFLFWCDRTETYPKMVRQVPWRRQGSLGLWLVAAGLPALCAINGLNAHAKPEA